LVDAEIALQEPVPALFAERRKRTVAYLAREIDAELRAQAPADLPENANPEPLPTEGLPGIICPAPLNSRICKTERRGAKRSVSRSPKLRIPSVDIAAPGIIIVADQQRSAERPFIADQLFIFEVRPETRDQRPPAVPAH